MRILVTLKVPISVVQKMDVFKKKYFPAGFRKIPSHITLLAPFDLAGDFHVFTNELSKIAQNFSPFPLAINGLGIFHEKVLFFYFTKPDGLGRLQQEVLSAITSAYRRETKRKNQDADEYHPHSTISISSAERIIKYKAEIERSLPKLNFLVDGVTVYVWRRDYWRLEKELEFHSQ